jgi:hypothetical protein
MTDQNSSTPYLSPIYNRAASAIADVLSESGLLPPAQVMNCAQACLTRLAGTGLAIVEGKMELWQGSGALIGVRTVAGIRLRDLTDG